jgi:predicted 3-demethylubiquinone-9 3-methyltransferase (glyoxalase superfamily)
MQKITPFLWFNDKAEEAVKFYTSIFKNSKILGVTRYGEEGATAA